MKKKSVVFLFVVLFLNHFSLADNFNKWSDIKLVNISLNYNLIKDNTFQKNLFMDTTFLYASGSIFKYFGLGFAFLDFFSLPTSGEHDISASFLPIKLCFIPFIKTKEITIQPVEKTYTIPGQRVYEYYPDKKEIHKIADVLIYSSVVASAWAWRKYDPEKDANREFQFKDLFNGGWYIRTEIGIEKSIVLSKKPMFLWEIMSIGFKTGIYWEKHKIKGLFYSGIYISLGSTDVSQ